MPLLLWLAPRLGWLDRPDPRKPHLKPVPPIGGVVWFVGFAAALLLAGVVHSQPAWTIMACLATMLLVGLADDLKPQSSLLRLGMQAAITTVLAWSGVMLVQTLGVLLPGTNPVNLGFAAVFFSIFAGVGVVNALNMCDGMDGLAGSQVGIALLALVVLYSGSPHEFEFALTVAALGGLVPFLLLNLRLPWQARAKVFFGDAGSMSAGLLLAVLVVRGSQGPAAVMSPACALWLLAVPLIDTVSVMLRRIGAGGSPFKPDQQHVHHVLLRAGLTVPAVWAVLSLAALGCATIAIAMAWSGVPEFVQFGAFLGMALGYHRWVCAGLRNGHVLGRTLSPQLSRL